MGIEMADDCGNEWLQPEVCACSYGGVGMKLTMTVRFRVMVSVMVEASLQ